MGVYQASSRSLLASVLLTSGALFAGGCGNTLAESPSAAPASPGAARAVVVGLSPTGYSVDGATVASADAAAEELGRLNAESPIAVRIEAPASSTLERVAELVDKIRAQGVRDVALVALNSAGVAADSAAAAASAAPPPAGPSPAAPAALPAHPLAEGAEAAEPTPPSPPAPPAAESLPEVLVKNIGLHVGGGTNTDAEKAPFRAAVEKHFDELRACYRQVEDPLKGGVFGLDLRIGRDGGKAQVSQPRTSMKGEAFRKCVFGVFQSVEFDKPAKGPTVISYSVRFSAK